MALRLVQIDGLYQQLCAPQQAPQPPGHNRKAELTALLTHCGAWYQDVFFFDVSDEEYQIVAQQVGDVSIATLLLQLLVLTPPCIVRHRLAKVLPVW
jgi:hypothetical protein